MIFLHLAYPSLLDAAAPRLDSILRIRLSDRVGNPTSGILTHEASVTAQCFLLVLGLQLNDAGSTAPQTLVRFW